MTIAGSIQHADQEQPDHHDRTNSPRRIRRHRRRRWHRRRTCADHRSQSARRRYIHDLTAHHTTGVIGGLLTSVGAFLLIPAMAALLSLVRGAGAKLATASAILIGCGGAALGAGDAMITLVMGSLVPHHSDTAATMIHIANNNPLLGLPFTFAPLLVVGFILLGVALLRAKTVPAWQAILLIVGGLLVFASSGGGLSAAATLVPLGAALVVLGRRAAVGA